jgi:exopolysaccharide biosynthesis WecB/TagA/CpsF family protein
MTAVSHRVWPGVDVAGLRFAAVDEATVVDAVVSEAEAGHGGWFATVNVDILRRAVNDPRLMGLLRRASFVVADGAPLVWASRLARTPLPERITGSTLIWSLSRAASTRQLSVFLLGGNPGVAALAADALRKSIPDLQIAGVHCPPFGFERVPEEHQRIEDALRSTAPRFVFCGLGFPKQEFLIERLIGEFASAWFMPCGAGLSFAAGERTRAPVWMQSVGLEWVSRLVQEPGRLFRRYVVDDLPFAVELLARSSLGAPARDRMHGAGPMTLSH